LAGKYDLILEAAHEHYFGYLKGEQQRFDFDFDEPCWLIDRELREHCYVQLQLVQKQLDNGSDFAGPMDSQADSQEE